MASPAATSIDIDGLSVICASKDITSLRHWVSVNLSDPVDQVAVDTACTAQVLQLLLPIAPTCIDACDTDLVPLFSFIHRTLKSYCDQEEQDSTTSISIWRQVLPFISTALCSSQAIIQTQEATWIECGNLSLQELFQMTNRVQETTDEMKEWILNSAKYLFHTHQTVVEKAEANIVHLRLMTFIWKNLTKLSTRFGELLLNSSQIESPSSFVVKDMLEAARYAIERILLPISIESELIAESKHRLRAFQLFWKAFHTQFHRFASHASPQWLEELLQTLLFVISHLLDVSSLSPLQSLILQSISSITSFLLPPTSTSVLPASVAETMSTLLFSDDFQSRFQDAQKHHASYILLTATVMADSQDLRSVDTSELEEEDRATTAFDQDTQLLAALQLLFQQFTSVPPHLTLFITPLVHLCTFVTDLSSLHVLLLKQCVHPSGPIRIVAMNVMQELLCHEYLDRRQKQAMWSSLIDWYLQSDGMEYIEHLVQYLYPVVDSDMQKLLVEYFDKEVEEALANGPIQYDMTNERERVWKLLELLCTDANVLLYLAKEQVVEDWIDRTLRLTFEFWQFLLAEMPSSMFSSASNLRIGAILGRLILVNRQQKQDTNERVELECILVQLTTKSVSLAAKYLLSDRSLQPVLEALLKLLHPLGPILKRNRQEQFVQVLESIVVIGESHPSDEIRVVLLGCIEETLSDVQVTTPADVSCVHALFTRAFACLWLSETLGQEACMAALYRFLAKSNVPTHLGFHLPSASARSGFLAYVEGIKCKEAKGNFLSTSPASTLPVEETESTENTESKIATVKRLVRQVARVEGQWEKICDQDLDIAIRVLRTVAYEERHDV